GEKVFFYRSPFNGSVYFDDLGPPWPKHPCMDTDNLKVVKIQAKHSLHTGIYHQLARRESGWLPVVCVSVQRYKQSKSIIIIRLLSQAGIIKIFYANIDLEKLNFRSPFLVRTSSKNIIYEISTLEVGADVPCGLRFYASTTLSALRSQLEQLASEAKNQSETFKPKQAIKIGISATKNIKIKQKISSPKITVSALPMIVKKKKRKMRILINPADVPVTYRKPAIFPKKSKIS
ncbi:MAG: hypothetical protein Q7T50_08410, partial [Candidatus Magasanikbacteria bacterium]|nr:hypothetical protein [Candidatus Magasanikbacteria bacterium]